jgi:glycosyltransferase involved in cell wall biosynthesis
MTSELTSVVGRSSIYGRSHVQLLHSASHFENPVGASPAGQRSLVSIVVPAYNEAALLTANMTLLCDYLATLEARYDWEIVIVNDGSADNTGELAEAFASQHNNILVLHHMTNFGLGQALKTGFAHCQGDYIVTLDIDLSYAPEHIEQLLLKIQQTGAKIVLTSPYMPGGKVSNVPWWRLVLSVWANRFLATVAQRNLSTFTSMVRVYDAQFLRILNLRSQGVEINPEAIRKALVLDAKIAEIPAHLNWRSQPARPGTKKPSRRRSSVRILRHTWQTLYAGFIFRPMIAFMLPSLLFFLFSLYASGWAFAHCVEHYFQLAQTTPWPNPTAAVALAFQQSPHTFVIGGITFIVSTQFFSLGVLSAQNKHYFEEVFYLGTHLNQHHTERRRS